MSPTDSPLGDPIPFDNVPAAPGSSKIRHNTPPAALEPMAIEESSAGSVEGSSRIRTFESDSKLSSGSEMEFKRPMNTTGTGATRVRTFHAKLNDGAFHFLDNQINEWLDAHSDIEVKSSNPLLPSFSSTLSSSRSPAMAKETMVCARC